MTSCEFIVEQDLRYVPKLLCSAEEVWISSRAYKARIFSFSLQFINDKNTLHIHRVFVILLQYNEKNVNREPFSLYWVLSH